MLPAFEDKVIQKEALAEQVALDFGQFGFLADVVPSVPDSADLPVDDVLRRILAELEIWRGLKAGRKGAHPIVSDDQHRLARPAVFRPCAVETLDQQHVLLLNHPLRERVRKGDQGGGGVVTVNPARPADSMSTPFCAA